MNVDAYQLILEKGTLGALRYADAVDVENPVLASQIEEAVIRLQKLSEQAKVGMVRTAQLNYQQAPQIQIPQSWKQPLPNGEPREITLPELQQVFGKNFEKIPEDDWFSRPAAWASFLGNAGVSSVQIKAIMNGINFHKARMFINLAANATDKAKKLEFLEKATKFRQKLPKQVAYNFDNLFFKNKAAPDWLKGPQNTSNLQEAFYNQKVVPHADKWKLWQNQIKSKLKSDYIKAEKPKHIKRLLDEYMRRNPNATSAQINQYKRYIALNDKKLIQFLAKQANAIDWTQNPQYKKIFDQLNIGKPIGTALGTNPISSGTKASAPANLMAQLFDDLGKWGPLRFFKTFANQIRTNKVSSLLGKSLGPIFIVLQSAGIIDDWRKNGFDARLMCEMLSVLAGAASFIPVLTPIAAPLGIALSIGCAFVPRKEKKTPEQLTKADYDERMKTIKLQDLSPGDQQKIQKLMSQYGDNREALVQAFQVGARSFDNPLDAGAYVKKMWADKNKVPASPDTSKMVPVAAF